MITTVRGVYLNFDLWGLALLPGGLIVKEIGVKVDQKIERDGSSVLDGKAAI